MEEKRFYAGLDIGTKWIYGTIISGDRELHIVKEGKFPCTTSALEKWYVASCPLLDVATQGKTESEVRKSIRALINEYMKDPDTKKPSMNSLMEFSLVTVPVTV